MRAKASSTEAARLKALRQAQARLRCIIDHDLTGISFAHLEGPISEANDVFLKIIGCSREDLETGKLNWRELTPPEQRHVDDEAIKKLCNGGNCAPFEKEYVRKDGSRVSVLFSASLLAKSKSELVCFSLDLSEYKEVQEKVNYLAYHDSLTNLPNQALFKDRLDQALGLSRRNDDVLAIVLVNLDRFKTINDTLGYVTGDQILRDVATRLNGCVRETDTVARFVSDEFA
ncbi:MAG TPA: sensor domain-containing diguanylate cyclase, partial [Pyrinomonadaceae bacterium]|nr:sensor domain-containing diguanylate cyclase [Pyrinomonadaceae bacterium]